MQRQIATDSRGRRNAVCLGLAWVATGWAIVGCSGPGSLQEKAPRPRLFQVVSSSMEPRLRGPCLVGLCDHCRFPLRFSADTYNTNVPSRCYHCGASIATEALETALQPGEIVEPLIGGDAARGSAPQADSQATKSPMPDRLDLIVFRTQAGMTAKRIWGLPGEAIELVDGELWVDQELFSKSLDQLRAVAVPVAEFPVAKFSVPDALRPRSLSSACTTGKLQSDNGAELSESMRQITMEPRAEMTWTYARPARVIPAEVHAAEWLVASGLNDDYPNNQGLSYQFQPVDDFLLEVEFAAPIKSPFTIRCQTRVHDIQVVFFPESSMLRKSKLQQNAPERLVLACRVSATVAVCDGRILLSSDCGSFNREVDFASHPNAGFNVKFINGTHRLAIQSIQISRDLFIRTDSRTGDGRQLFRTVPDSSYLVIGDNVPASQDSRTDETFVGADEVIGLLPPARK